VTIGVQLRVRFNCDSNSKNSGRAEGLLATLGKSEPTVPSWVMARSISFKALGIVHWETGCRESAGYFATSSANPSFAIFAMSEICWDRQDFYRWSGSEMI
jgi:hypothetical protein